jgi:hypothetical protein
MKQSKINLFTGLILATVIAVFSSTAVFGQTFRVEGAGLEASPTNYSGKCPVVITFKGKIQTKACFSAIRSFVPDLLKSFHDKISRILNVLRLDLIPEIRYLHKHLSGFFFNLSS